MRWPLAWLTAVVVAASLTAGAVPPARGQVTVEPEVVFQSEVLERTTGEPNVHQVSFGTCDTDSLYRLVIENGVDGSPRVSSGILLLNGMPVVTESELNQQVSGVVRPVALESTNVLEVRLAGGPGGRFRVTIDGHPRCLRVRIVAPLSGTVLSEPATVVEGEVHSPGTAGVRLRVRLPLPTGHTLETFVPAQVNGRRFAAWLPLTPGTVHIAAVASDDTGRTEEDAVTVQFVPDPPGNDRPYVPEVSPTVGFPPLAVTFDGSMARNPDVDRLEWDFDGDGQADIFLPDLVDPPHQVTYVYRSEGLYVARLTVHDRATGRTLTASVPINVVAVPDLPAIWGDFRAALARGDRDAVLRMIALADRARYQRVLDDLGPDLGALASELQDLTLTVVRPGYATGSVVRVRDGVTEGFVLSFVRDADGVWRISGL
jgi:hypothetical protein